MAKFIVVSYPHSYDTYIDEFDTLDDALDRYREAIQYDSEVILAQVLEVELKVKLSPDINED